MFSRLAKISSHLTSIVKPMATSTSSPFRKPLHTAACLIIGDEVLNGKTVDTNSPYFAKYCFDLGIELKRIEVIADDKDDIIEAARRMSANYDFVVTSGGIGPTHDDITYPSIAAAFNLPLVRHAETEERMRRLSKRDPPFDFDTPSPTLTARMRMADLPSGPSVRTVYVVDDMWVPICVVNYNIHILPGVPGIFVSLLEGLKTILEKEGRLDKARRMTRVLISTAASESEVALFLTELQEKVKSKGVKVGSYPRWGKDHNTVTLVGSDKEYIESLIKEVEEGVKGKRVEDERENDMEMEVTATAKEDGVKSAQTERKS